MTEQKKRTVSIACAIPQGLKLTLNDPNRPGVVLLKPGHNPNIDKEFAEEWRKANANFSAISMLTFADEQDDDTEQLAPGDHPTENPSKQGNAHGSERRYENSGEEAGHDNQKD